MTPKAKLQLNAAREFLAQFETALNAAIEKDLGGWTPPHDEHVKLRARLQFALRRAERDARWNTRR